MVKEEEKELMIKSTMVFHVEVGHLDLAVTTEDKYIESWKVLCNKDGLLDRLKEQGIECVWLPTRAASRVVILPLS